ncbi:hypothetical protein PG994_003466 [Apiospora phragmitis]|uniref:Uncharacterized protein n=1 Tax=Apiospora phragmitis TaxID=2905665 RepID=A0ABR1VY95_9PEZI
MASGKNTNSVPMEELERKFASLSLKVEKEQEACGSQAQKGSRSSSDKNPFLKRHPTKNELLDGITKLENLCYEVQDNLQPYIEAEERMEQSKFVMFLNFVLYYL